MERDNTVTVDTDDDRVDGHSFEKGYELHDMAEAHVDTWVSRLGLRVEQWGINRREDKHVLSDDKMDLRLYDGDDLVAVVEVKSKQRASWFGIINRDHYHHYLQQYVEHTRVPFYIYMCRLDERETLDGEDTKMVIANDAFIPIKGWTAFRSARAKCHPDVDTTEELIETQVTESPQVERQFQAPDGNMVVKLEEDTYLDSSQFTFRLGKRVGSL
jgi:hypothetical protein